MASSPIRSVTRAIDLLQALNRQPVSSVDDLHIQTGIPKPSIVRLLRTFVMKGLVCHAPQHGAYYLTSQVQSLSVGYHSEPRIVEAAAPLLDAMTRRVKWPMAVAVPDNNAVIIRYSTVPLSPLSLLHSSINMRLSLVTRARLAGRFSPSATTTSANISSMPCAPRPSRRIRPRTTPRPSVRFWRRSAPAATPCGIRNSGRVSNTLAVPIFDGPRVVATVGLTFISSALKPEQAVKDHLDEVKDIAVKISGRLTALHPKVRCGWPDSVWVGA